MIDTYIRFVLINAMCKFFIERKFDKFPTKFRTYKAPFERNFQKLAHRVN